MKDKLEVAREIIDYVENFGWNCQYSKARHEEQEARVVEMLGQLAEGDGLACGLGCSDDSEAGCV